MRKLIYPPIRAPEGMSGQQRYRMDTKDWPMENELAFIHILLGKLKQSGNISFKRAIWSEMDNELFTVVGERYGVEKLRGKFNRLRKKYREFSELISHDHVVWDHASNKVLAPEDVWSNFCLRGKSFKAFRKRGCDHFDLLGQIFGGSSPSGLAQHSSSTHEQLEEEFIATKVSGSEQDSPSEGEGDSESFKDLVGKRTGQLVLEERCKKRNTTESTVEASVSTKSEVPNKTKCGSGNSMSERARTRTPNKITDPYSIELCMDALNSMEDISTASYNACLEKFTDRIWRKMFMMMPVSRRKGWLEGLIYG
ncbi:hypothetical protein SAY86_003404 [Trapa natans]|uniref:Myb/SANT-like domain-containing protein n=1 Tax=Trapa natans TaxID=22666 RepID=A0AAN7MS37_TRANT|nr:hypothetical protein SAY86_003404 [Trapa natans]